MEDMDDVRNPHGVVADFSSWEGMGTKGFERMKALTIKEKIIEPETVDETKKPRPVKEEAPQPIDEKKIDLNSAKRKLPNQDMHKTQNEIQRELEIANIALQFMPKADILTNDNFSMYYEKAIGFALRFKADWRKTWEKLQEEKQN